MYPKTRKPEKKRKGKREAIAIWHLQPIPQHIFCPSSYFHSFKLAAAFIYGGGGSASQRKTGKSFFPIHHRFETIAEAIPGQLLRRHFSFQALFHRFASRRWRWSGSHCRREGCSELRCYAWRSLLLISLCVSPPPILLLLFCYMVVVFVFCWWGTGLFD